MIFYQGLLERKIWDPEKEKVTIDFGPNKVFETEDEEIIAKLTEMGYPTEADMHQLEATGTLPHGGFQKRDMDSEYPSGRKAVEEPGDSTPKPMVRETMNDPLPNSEEAEMAASVEVVDKVLKRKKAAPKKTIVKKTIAKKVIRKKASKKK